MLLGARPYGDVPAYMQHADVLIVPHLVSPFTESLDPIKAYESLAVDTPTLATPVAGFRELADYVSVVQPEAFPRELAALILAPPLRSRPSKIPSWDDRAREFERLLTRARSERARAAPLGVHTLASGTRVRQKKQDALSFSARCNHG